MILRITAPHFVAGVDVSGDAFLSGLKDTRPACAPIIGYMRTWTQDEIVRYCEAKGWGVEYVDA